MSISYFYPKTITQVIINVWLVIQCSYNTSYLYGSDHDILLCLADVEQVITDRWGDIESSFMSESELISPWHIGMSREYSVCVCDEKTWASDWVNIWRTCLFDPFQSKEQQGCEHNFLIHCLCLSFSHACCLCVSLKQVRPTELPLWSLSRGWFGCVGEMPRDIHSTLEFNSLQYCRNSSEEMK